MSIKNLFMAGLVVTVLSAGAYAGGCYPYHIDKNSRVEQKGNTLSAKNTKAYGVMCGLWSKITNSKLDYVPTKIKIKVSNRCYFLRKGVDGWKREEWRKIDDDTLELDMGEYAAKGAELYIGDIKDKKNNAWNVFDMPLNCSEEPQREEWTVYQEVNGRWQVTARQKFIINP